MLASHRHFLYRHAPSRLHGVAPERKILALVAFVLVVVATPLQWWWLFLGYALVVSAGLVLARIPLRWLAPRLIIELPFVVTALLLPFVATGPTETWGPLELSDAGLLAAGNLLAKGLLGVTASLTLAATTSASELIAGLERLRLPAPLLLILSFMVRYGVLITEDLQRMLVAQTARGFDPRSVRHWPALAAGVGALFIRSYERGERVHRAMLARGHGVEAAR